MKRLLVLALAMILMVSMVTSSARMTNGTWNHGSVAENEFWAQERMGPSSLQNQKTMLSIR